MGRKIEPEVIMADYTPRPLAEDERAARRKCYHCGSHKTAWAWDAIGRSTGQMHCRVCGAEWWANF
jgi:transcription elongation factor Elf1